MVIKRIKYGKRAKDDLNADIARMITDNTAIKAIVAKIQNKDYEHETVIKANNNVCFIGGLRADQNKLLTKTKDQMPYPLMIIYAGELDEVGDVELYRKDKSDKSYLIFTKENASVIRGIYEIDSPLYPYKPTAYAEARLKGCYRLFQKGNISYFLTSKEH